LVPAEGAFRHLLPGRVSSAALRRLAGRSRPGKQERQKILPNELW